MQIRKLKVPHAGMFRPSKAPFPSNEEQPELTINTDMAQLSPKLKQHLPASLQMSIQHEIATMISNVTEAAIKLGARVNSALNYMRARIVFHEAEQLNPQMVNDLVGTYASHRIKELEQQVLEKDEQIKSLYTQKEDESTFNEGVFRRTNKLGVIQEHIGPQFVAQKLYAKAKELSLPEFEDFYNETSLQNRLELVTIKDPKRRTVTETSLEEKKRLPVVPLENLLQKFSSSQIDELKRLIGEKNCMNPCCRWQQVQAPVKEVQERIWGGPSKVRSQSCYQSDKIRDVFARHYRKMIKPDRRVNMQRIKTEQMETGYTKTSKKSKDVPNLTHFRSRSVV